MHRCVQQQKRFHLQQLEDQVERRLLPWELFLSLAAVYIIQQTIDASIEKMTKKLGKKVGIHVSVCFNTHKAQILLYHFEFWLDGDADEGDKRA